MSVENESYKQHLVEKLKGITVIGVPFSDFPTYNLTGDARIAVSALGQRVTGRRLEVERRRSSRSRWGLNGTEEFLEIDDIVEVKNNGNVVFLATRREAGSNSDSNTVYDIQQYVPGVWERGILRYHKILNRMY